MSPLIKLLKTEQLLATSITGEKYQGLVGLRNSQIHVVNSWSLLIFCEGRKRGDRRKKGRGQERERKKEGKRERRSEGVRKEGEVIRRKELREGEEEGRPFIWVKSLRNP